MPLLTPRNKLFLFLGFTVLSTVAWFSKGGSGSSDKAVFKIEKKDIVQQVTVAGSVIPLRKTVISPPYNAYIKKIYVKVGDVIKAGDPIVSLTQSLRELGDPAYPLRAPFAGTVVQVPKTEGEYVEAGKDGNLLVRIDDTSRLFIRSEIPESDVKKIKPGFDVLIKVNGVPEKEYHGKIKSIALASKEKPGWNPTGDRVAFEVEIEILDKDERVLPGMSSIIDIITAKKEQALAIPLECVEKGENGYSVTLQNGKKEKIEVGLQNDRFFEVLKGLKENDAVRVVDFYSLSQQGT